MSHEVLRISLAAGLCGVALIYLSTKKLSFLKRFLVVLTLLSFLKRFSRLA